MIFNRKHTTKEKGFTLIEILIALVIGSIVTGSAYHFFSSQSRYVLLQLKQANIEQNLRASIFILEQEIKKIGYNPLQIKGLAAPGIIAAEPGWLTYQADLNENGSGFNGYGGLSGSIYNNDKDPGETISIGLKKDCYGNGDHDGDGIADTFPSRLWQETENHPLVVAENIEVVNFEYLDPAGDVLSQPVTDLTEINQVQVTIIARAGTPTGGFKNNRTYYNPQGETIFKAPGDSFLRGIVSKTINCRNLRL